MIDSSPRNSPWSSIGPSTNTLPRASRLYFTQCIQAALIYRSSLAIFVVTEAFAYAGFIAFWHKAATSNPKQNIYTPMGLVLYFALASFHHSIQHHTSSRDIGSEIRLGKLSYTMIRPFPYLLQAFIRSMAFTLTYSVLLTPIIIGSLVLIPNLFLEVNTNVTPLVGLNYFLALGVGLLAGWLIRIAVGLLAFDMSQIWGPDTLFIALYYSASGVVFPIDLLPANLLAIAHCTPMYYMVGFPVLTLMGRIPQDMFYYDLGRGCLVLALTSLVITILWKRGIRRFEAIGI